MLYITSEHAFIEPSISIIHFSRPLVFVSHDVTTKSRAIHVCHLELASHLIAVEVAIMNHTLRMSHLASAMSPAHVKATFIDSSIGVGLSPLPLVAITPFASVLCAIDACELSLSMSETFFVLAFIEVAIGHVVSSLAVRFVIAPLTLIDRHVLESYHADALPGVGTRNQLASVDSVLTLHTRGLLHVIFLCQFLSLCILSTLKCFSRDETLNKIVPHLGTNLR